MGRKKKTFFEESLANNQIAYYKYMNLLIELCVGSWQWVDFPDSIDSRYVETCLMREGIAIYFNDEVMGNLCLNATYAGNFDVYGYPVLRRAYSNYNGYQAYLNPQNSVIVFNNNTRTNSLSMLMNYAKRLYTYDRIMDINVNAQKTPVALTASESQRLTALNAYKEYDGNAPVILLNENFNPNTFGSIKTDAPFTADKIYALKVQIWNEALAYLGIRNVNQTKRERLVTAEAEHSNIDAEYMRWVKQACRDVAVEKINKMFGTSGRVEFIGDQVLKKMVEERGIDEMMGGDVIE